MDIVDIHFTDIGSVFKPIFTQMTEKQKDEMRKIFGEPEYEKEMDDRLHQAAKDAFNDGYEEGYEYGHTEGFEAGFQEGESGA